MITDEMVEEAARRAWCAPMEDGDRMTAHEWSRASERDRAGYRSEARAVLEYASTLGPSREERLMRYRCAALPAVMAQFYGDTTAQNVRTVEDTAHAMLAAERPAAPPAADEVALTAELVAVLQKNKALLLKGIADAHNMLVARNWEVIDDVIMLLNDLLPKEAP